MSREAELRRALKGRRPKGWSKPCRDGCRITSRINGRSICSWCGRPGQPNDPVGIGDLGGEVVIPALPPAEWRWLYDELLRGAKR